MLTKQDLQNLKDIFATKDDFNKFATKVDLKAQTLELEQKFATKDDLKDFTTRDDLVNLVKSLEDIFYTKVEMDKKFEEQRQGFSNLGSAVDKVVKEYKKLSTESLISGNRIMRVEQWVSKAARKINLPYNP